MTRHQYADLSIRVTEGDPVVLSVAGELDIASAPALRRSLLDTLAETDGIPVALDASGLTFVDSSGLAVLLMGARRFAEADKTLLLRPSPPLDRVIGLTGVREAFEYDLG
jgi:anti-anti-sigma factor